MVLLTKRAFASCIALTISGDAGGAYLRAATRKTSSSCGRRSRGVVILSVQRIGENEPEVAVEVCTEFTIRVVEQQLLCRGARHESSLLPSEPTL